MHMAIPSGRTRRTVEKTARTATEHWRVDFDGMRERPLEEGELVLDEYRFDGAPDYGPVIVYSRELSIEATRVLSSHIVPPPVYVPPEPHAPIVVDASEYEVLPDAEFWAVIDLLEGKAWENKLSRAERVLAEHSEEFILRFAQTMMAKAYLLDDPRVLPTFVTERGTRAIYTERRMDDRAAVIVGGRERFESVLANPRNPEPAWTSDSTWWVFHLADAALGRQRKSDVRITTSIPRGRVAINPDHWSTDHGLEFDPPTPEKTPEELEAIRVRLEEINKDYIARSGIDPAFSMFGDQTNGHLSWHVVRYFVLLENGGLEHVVLHAASSTSPKSIERDVAQMVASRVGGTVLGEVTGGDRMMNQLFSIDAGGAKVKSSLSVDAHIALYFHGIA